MVDEMTDHNNAAQPGLTDDEILQVFADVVGNQEDDARFIDVDRDQAIRIARTLLPKLRAEGVQAGVDWRPMDIAPLDGREVLLQVERRAGIPGRCLVGHYMPGGHCIEDHPPIAQGWYFWDGREFDLASKPTGWLPLPPDEIYAALASAPVADAMTFEQWWPLESHRRKYPTDHPAYLAAREAWDAKPQVSAPVAGEAQPVAWRAVWTLPTSGATAWCDARKAAPPDETELLAKGYRLELAYAAPQASEAVRNAGIELAASWVDKRRQDFDHEHGYMESDTGAWSFGTGARATAKAEYSAELDAIAEGIRALKTQADQDGGDWEPQTPQQIAANMRNFARAEGFDWPAPDCAKGAGDEAMRDALEMLIREAQAVADDHHRPRYTRLDEAIQSARAALSPTQPTGGRDEA